jgi:hypothetical protein
VRPRTNEPMRKPEAAPRLVPELMALPNASTVCIIFCSSSADEKAHHVW